jgi:signal transduction histidine kinase
LFAQQEEVFALTNTSLNNISMYAYIAADESNIEDYQQALSQLNFTKTTQRLPTISQTKGSTWFKINVVNLTANNEFRLTINNTIIDRIDYFLLAKDTFLERHVGEHLPFSKHKYQSPVYAFKVLVQPNDTATLLFRIKGIEDYFVPINISGEKELLEQQLGNNLLIGIYAGLMIVMFLYNLFIFFSVKDRSYIYYVTYIGMVFITQLSHYSIPFQYIWPENTWLQLRSLIIFPTLSGIMGILFMREFLHVKKDKHPKYNAIIWLLVWVYIFVLIIMLLNQLHMAYKILQFAAVIVSLFMLFTAIDLFRKGSRPAGFFLISWTFFLAGIVLFILKDIGVLPFNLFTQFSMPIGSAIEVTLLSFALGDRINILKKEKEKSQAEALRISLENEKLIKEQNVILEQKVNERTIELQQALKNLKDAQTQLVDQEKMASLGQLTAGIAHEINNPINFVTSNVSPLKRDIAMINQLIDDIETIAVKEENTADERQQQINNLKSNIDLDYLREEINFLLKGIGEGAGRTAEIVKSLRIFSRLDEDAIKKADVVEGIESTIIIINNQLNKINIEKNFTGNRIIDCYPGKLNQVFLNLLTNAIYAVKQKFGSEEGGLISISSKSDDNFVYLSFKDNGIGMDENTQKHIFEPFFTTKPVGEGTGLGMSIVFKTIEQHKGGITLHSTPGIGTEFNIKLPINLL